MGDSVLDKVVCVSEELPFEQSPQKNWGRRLGLVQLGRREKGIVWEEKRMSQRGWAGK